MTWLAILGSCAASFILGCIGGFAVAARIATGAREFGVDDYERGFEDGLARSYAPQPADVHGDVPHLGGRHG